MHKVHGEKAWDMPPFRRVQDSGIVWGLGSDATAVTTSNPFYTLSLAVTGEMIGGAKVNARTRTSCSRKETWARLHAEDTPTFWCSTAITSRCRRARSRLSSRS